jgi:hypothetical protein
MDTLTFTLTKAEVQIIADALSLRPYGEVYQLVAKMQAQAVKQQDKSSDSPANTQNQKN